MKPEEYWNEDCILVDLLFTTNLPVTQIAKELDWTTAKTSQRIKQLGLSWVRRNDRKLSRGHSALTDIMRKLLPGEEIVNEHPIGERLRLDIFCPSYSLAAEYHGRQHFFYTDHFHGSKEAFEDSQRRDDRKEELCKELGIALVVFRYNDELTDDAVFNRMMLAITQTAPIEKVKKTSFKGNHYYEQMKKRDREYRKQAYRKMKQNKKNGN